MRVQRWVKLSLAVATSLLLTVSSSACVSQPASSRETPEQAARTKIEFPAEGVHPTAQATLDERLRAHLDYLTSETCQGRQVGTLGAGRAAGYVLQEFKSIGLEPAFGDGHVQEFIPLNVAKIDTKLEILDSKKNVVKSFAFYHDFNLVSYTKSGETLITAKLVDVSNKTGDFGPEASGAVALVRTDSNRFYGMRGRAERAHSAALILCEADRPPGLLPRRQFDSAPKPQGMTFPILWVEPACFEELAKAASAGGSVRIGITSESRPEVVGFNIAGATGDPSAKKVIVVCAHRDAMGQLADGTTFPGAIDNASGTATLIELARVLSKSSPDKAFVFLSTDSEESYMEGATFFATHLPFRTENLAAVVNLGCIGVLGEDQGYTVIGIIAPRDGFVRYHTLADTVDALDIGELATVVEALTRALTEP